MRGARLRALTCLSGATNVDRVVMVTMVTMVTMTSIQGRAILCSCCPCNLGPLTFLLRRPSECGSRGDYQAWAWFPPSSCMSRHRGIRRRRNDYVTDLPHGS
jgi:hypothetical protein